MADSHLKHPYSSDFLAALTGIIAQWTAPTFLVNVIAREGIDLDSTSITAIHFLDRQGPLRPSVLADQLGTGASNVSKVLGRLEAAGLIERRKDDADARATLIHLTSAGDEAAAAFVRAGDGMLDELLDGWTDKERHLLTQLTQRLDGSTRAFAAKLTSLPSSPSQKEQP
ncbi:DNA-binding MarR family transcriptional regulator [Okibacterium sp. HSC-33S16]|uniref:MarR family winged helix-turn-helix transcriptional regulator n=1 Tax=Okibacterium sp. HSC-33S16 TaxID=2910965 RepID=UPI00209EAD40|nr:MarR family transcriptional regulator [Okibacterium sp. HSC-33S16]MCP2031107.1 DNA-binding MarR family transcriptional regulator [Okibacterium sp. HSC-33S16]